MTPEPCGERATLLGTRGIQEHGLGSFQKYLPRRELSEPAPKAIQDRIFPLKEGIALYSRVCPHRGGHLCCEYGIVCVLYSEVKTGKRNSNVFLSALLVLLNILHLSSVRRKVLPQERCWGKTTQKKAMRLFTSYAGNYNTNYAEHQK